MKKIYKIFSVLFFIGAGIFISACSDDDTDLGPEPQAAFTVGDNSVLVEGEEVTFISQSEVGKSFLWSFGDGEVAYGPTVTHTFATLGDFEVVLEVSANGQRNVASQIVSIAGIIPEPQFSVANPDDLSASLGVQFINETEDAISFLWEFGDVNGSTSTEENPVFVYNEPGDYEVTFTATGSGGSESLSQTIAVKPNPFVLYFIDNVDAKVKSLALADPATINDEFALGGFSFGLTYDPTAEEVYYSDDDSFKIFKNSINGGAEVEVASGFSGPRGIALDLSNNQIFVADRFGDDVKRVDLSDNSVTSYFGVADDEDYLLPLDVDIYDGVIYSNAVEEGSETIWTTDFEGNNLTNIINFDAGGFGYAITIDKENEKIYFDDNWNSEIKRANLDGTNVETVGSTSDRVYSIIVNNETSNIYWASQDGVIKVANLDGSGESTIAETGADIRGMILRKTN